MAAARFPPAAPPTPAPNAVPLSTVPAVRVFPLKFRLAAPRLNAYNPAPPAPIAAPFFPPARAPTPAPPAMIAAVRALRPNLDLRRVWPSAETSVPVMTSKVHTSIKASNLFIPDPPFTARYVSSDLGAIHSALANTIPHSLKG